VAELHSVLTIRIRNVGDKQKFIITNLHQMKEKVDIKQINQTKSPIYINHQHVLPPPINFRFFVGWLFLYGFVVFQQIWCNF